MDKKIRRIRVVPKRYTFTDEIEDIANDMLDMDVAKVHMYLSLMFGKADERERELFGFYINYRDVVFDFHSAGDKVHVGAYIAPRFRQAAERKKIKVRNIVARSLNLQGKVFVVNQDVPNDLYFSVKQKNDELFRRALAEYGDTEETRKMLAKECWSAIGNNLPVGILKYVPDVEEIARELFNIFKTTDFKGVSL